MFEIKQLIGFRERFASLQLIAQWIVLKWLLSQYDFKYSSHIPVNLLRINVWYKNYKLNTAWS